MIEAKQSLTGTINTSQSLTGELNKTTEYIQPVLQEKEVTPKKDVQEVTSDTEYDGLSKVIVNKIPDEYIIPKLGGATITKNGTYKASDDGLDGYNEVSVTTAGVDINDYFNTTYTNGNWQTLIQKIPKITINTDSCKQLFLSCPIKEIDEIIFTKPLTNATSMFQNSQFKKIIMPTLTFGSKAQIGGMFSSAYYVNVLDISGIDFSSATWYTNMFNDCGYNATVEDGGYAEHIPYVYVKDEAAQNWVLNEANGHPTNWSTNNVIIKST